MKYIFLLIIIGSAIGVFVLIIVPKYDAAQAMQLENDSYKSSLATATQLKQSRDALMGKYNSIAKADLDNIQILLPDSVNNIKLIIQIDSIATKNGLTSLRSVDYNAEKDASTDGSSGGAPVGAVAKAPYGEFTMTFSTSGTYKNFLAFLADIEQNLRIVDVKSITFSSADSSSEKDKNKDPNNAALSYKVTIKTYWLK